MSDRFPEWIRRSWGSGGDFADTKEILDDLHLNTVCQSARCPNIAECWRRHTATILILGNACTRKCAFCSVKPAAPVPVRPEEPADVAEAIERLDLAHAVITSPTRDDLADGGAGHFAETISAIRGRRPATTIEVLVPDFQNDSGAIAAVVDARPDVFGHNIETVERLHPILRDGRYSYRRSLGVLRTAAGLEKGVIIKSALMVGHGETAEEVRATLADLLEAKCEAVSIGQYLRPSKLERPVDEYVTPEQFAAYEAMAYELGFGFAVAGPFVRSSYHSEEALGARAVTT